MKAIVYTQYGPPDVLHWAEVPRPVPGDNDVLIRMCAASVTTGDVNARGFTFVPPGFGPVPRLMFGWKGPKQQVLGADLSGEVVEVGKNVTTFTPGDAVFGTAGARFGAYAEYICLPEDSVITKKPNRISHEEAAGVFFGAHTALYFLRDKGNIQPGQSILINGASGGVGTAAIQLGKHFGASVTGICSGRNTDLVLSLGADAVIDYTQEDPLARGVRYDAIMDTRGTITFGSAKRALTKNGRFLAVAAGPAGFARMLTSSMIGRKRIVGGVAAERKEDLEFFAELLSSDRLKVVVDKVYPLDQIVDAHRHVDSGRKKGNVIVTIP